jgi:replicative DNA helicase
MSGLLNRLPPHNTDAEQGTIGAVLLDNDTLHEIITIVRVDDFYRPEHQEIWRAILALYDRGVPIDPMTLIDELNERGTFDQIGGDEALSQILSSTPIAANGVYYAQIVQQHAIRREVIEASNAALREAYGRQHTAGELLEHAEGRLFAIASSRCSGDVVGSEQLGRDTFDHIEARSNGGVAGLETGFRDFDDQMGGMPNKGLIILAGRPSAGKTALALNIVDHAVVSLGQPALVVSLEMGREEVYERMLVARARVDGTRLRRQHIAHDVMQRIGQADAILRAAPLHVDEGPTRTASQIAALSRRQSLRTGLALLVVDYVQLVEVDESAGATLNEQLGKVSRRLKILAKELNAPVLLLSQLNRASENREDHRPRMADLRASGALEQDADQVLLLHRPDYYDPNDQPGIAELIVAKNRNGPTGTIRLTFTKASARFDNHLELVDCSASPP